MFTEPSLGCWSSGHRNLYFAATTANSATNCVLCKTDKHPMYACTRFKSLSHDKMISTLKANDLCMNCLRPGHYVKQCKFLHRCKKCQRPHHTLLHVEGKDNSPTSLPLSHSTAEPVVSNAAAGLTSNSLLMTCRVLVDVPDGSSVEARAILDSASSASFVSERLTQALSLSHSHQSTRISGIAGLSHNSPLQSITNFTISSVRSRNKRIEVMAVIVPRATCDLLLYPVPFAATWNHLSDIPHTDPDFGRPGRTDILLGVDVFVETLLHGRRIGPPASPITFETDFGWVLTGQLDPCTPSNHDVIMSPLPLETICYANFGKSRNTQRSK